MKNQLANQHCMVSSGLRSTCFVTFTFHSTLLFPHFRDAGALWAQPPALAHLLPLCLLFTRGCRAKTSSAWFPAISSLPPFSLPFLYSLDPTLLLSLLSIYYKILCPHHFGNLHHVCLGFLVCVDQIRLLQCLIVLLVKYYIFH